jgi:class 3 adenylate cyclase
MNPRVRYTKASDGTHIAYWEAGEGPPLVYMPPVPFSHIQMEWDMPEYRRWYERLMATGHTVIRYDARGTGLSDRDCTDFTIEAYMRDLEATVDALKLGPLAIFATGDMGMAAIAWAAANPERVSHLVLWTSWASRANANVSGSPQTRSLRALIEQDWVTYTETAARVIMGWSGVPQEAARFAEFYRACTTQDVVLASVPGVYEWDVTTSLERLQCPVLVMQRREMPTLSSDVARDMAKNIPDARLALLDGRSPVPFLEDTKSVLQAIADFLGGDERPVHVMETEAGASVTILFTDMEGSTALTQRIGDTAAQEVVRAHNQIVREALATHGGTEIKHTGDGLMISFHSATQAIECATRIQHRVAEYAEKHPDTPLRVRCGINAGEPVAEGGDYFGTAVQLAARICALCEPGSVLVSGVVRDQVPRGFEDPVHLYEVRL